MASSYRSLLARPEIRSFGVAGSFSYGAPAAVVLVLVWSIATAPEYAGHLGYAALTLALVGLAAALPTLAAALVSGTLADRTERRHLMRVTNALTLLGAFGLFVDLYARPDAAIALPGPPGYFVPAWALLLLPCWAAISAATTLFRPAYNASLPKILPSSELASANGLIFALSILVSIAGSLGATGILALGRPVAGLAMLLPLTFLGVAQVALLSVHEDRPAPRSGPPASFVHDAREGYAYLWKRKELLEITVTALVINFLSTVAFVELGLYAADTLGISNAILYGAMVTGSSLGVALGSLLMGRFPFERNAGKVLALVTAGEGVSVLILGLSHTIWLSLPDMVLFGIFPGMYMTVFLATLQATVPNELLGRVLAADEVGSYAMVPFGQYFGGLLTLTLGSAQTPFLIAGIGTLVVGLLMFTLRKLRALGFEPHGHRTTGTSAPPVATAGVPGEIVP
ncbi:MAG: MFS transporter [Thermoplasmata archaeon]|nr:MFS transporter [Thermoplasmata archaeon]